MVDAARKRGEISILRAYYDSSVIGLLTMKLFEMQPIVRQNRATGMGRKRENFCIRYLLIGCACFERSKNVVSHFSKTPNCSKREILVPVKLSHDQRFPDRHPALGYFGRFQLCGTDNNS